MSEEVVDELLRDGPEQVCWYCGFSGQPYEFQFVFECRDLPKRLKTVRNMCPDCSVLSRIEGDEQRI